MSLARRAQERPQVEILIAELKAQRRLLGTRGSDLPPVPGRWNEANWAYDELLVIVADLLGVDDAPPPDQVLDRRRLTLLERCRVEGALLAAGVDLPVERAAPASRTLAAPRALPAAALPPGRREGPDARYPSDAPGPFPDWRASSPEPTTPIDDLLDGAHEAPADGAPAPLAAWARGLRHRLDGYETHAHHRPSSQEWHAELDAYDEALLMLAALIGPPDLVPAGGHRRLLPEQRVRIENGLACRGIDLSVPD